MFCAVGVYMRAFSLSCSHLTMPQRSGTNSLLIDPKGTPGSPLWIHLALSTWLWSAMQKTQGASYIYPESAEFSAPRALSETFPRAGMLDGNLFWQGNRKLELMYGAVESSLGKFAARLENAGLMRVEGCSDAQLVDCERVNLLAVWEAHFRGEIVEN